MVWKRIFYSLPALLWMILVFCFSAQPADASTEVSQTVGQTIGEWLVPGFEDWPQERQQSFAEAVDYPVRKSAHAAEYAVLAVLFAFMLCAYPPVRLPFLPSVNSLSLPAAWIFATAYAVTDELHQRFVPGRSGQVSDVLLDSAGALAGVLFCLLCRKLYSSFFGKKGRR